MLLDAVLLSRIQFAFTISFHILFPAFTIGLATYLAILEAMWLRSQHPVYLELYKWWMKVFAVAFGMGVVSGLVMAYAFGTNWSRFTLMVSNVIGPILGFEVLTAFFLEASFLGVMLFGWGRVSKGMHFFATLMVAFGTTLSAFWILSANSWMHTPTGFAFNAEGVMVPTDWLAVIFNPSFPYRFFHTLLSAYLTTFFVITGVGAYHLLVGKYIKHAKIMVSMGLMVLLICAPLQVVVGDMHGLNTLEHQPQKVSAMEGQYETERSAPLTLFAIPNEKEERLDYAIQIPGLTSLILTHHWDGEVKGLKDFPKDERPPVTIVFYSFRMMVGIGFAMLFTVIAAAILFARKRLYHSRLFHYWLVLMSPTGFIAVLCGWFVTEVGRQPFLVYGQLRTAEMASPLLAEHVLFTLITFIVVYSIVFGSGTYYIIRLLRQGPSVGDWIDSYGQHGVKHPVSFADVFLCNRHKPKES